MTKVWTTQGTYQRVGYSTEAELEEAVRLVQTELFGANRIYLDVKRKIGKPGSLRNIPDGYLLDLSSPRPRLYVVENELAAHDHLKHIAVQILEFSLSFRAQLRTVKSIVLGAMQKEPALLALCESYCNSNEFRNLDHLLEHLVAEETFAALVIIDEMPEDLEFVLTSQFKFPVEILELAKYQNDSGVVYHFQPFLAELAPASGSQQRGKRALDLGEVDTVVVPAQDEGFKEVFLGENVWRAIRLNPLMIPQLQHVAAYRVAPTSAITHAAHIASVEPYRDTGKWMIRFAEAAQKIGPVPLVSGGRVKAPQNIRYTSWSRLQKAKNLDELW